MRRPRSSWQRRLHTWRTVFALGSAPLYVTDSKASLARFNDALNGLGIDSAAELKRGALVESTHSEVHLDWKLSELRRRA